MRRAVQMALAVVWLACGVKVADAQRYYEVYAKPIYRKNVYMSSTGWKNFQTYNLGPATQFGQCYSPDTFMVITRPNGTTAYNDNCSKSTKRSCKNVDGTAGLWKVTVFAAQAQNCGSMDVSVGSTVLDRGVDFGGTIINLSSGLPNGVGFAFDTVHRPNGADDTVLIHTTPVGRNKPTATTMASATRPGSCRPSSREIASSSVPGRTPTPAMPRS